MAGELEDKGEVTGAPRPERSERPARRAGAGAWEHERDLLDARAGVGVRVYKRVLPGGLPSSPPVTQRSLEVVRVEASGQVRRHFPLSLAPHAGGALPGQEALPLPGFPTAALLRLVEEVQAAHEGERRRRLERIAASRAGKQRGGP